MRHRREGTLYRSSWAGKRRQGSEVAAVNLRGENPPSSLASVQGGKDRPGPAPAGPTRGTSTPPLPSGTGRPWEKIVYPPVSLRYGIFPPPAEGSEGELLPIRGARRPIRLADADAPVRRRLR